MAKLCHTTKRLGQKRDSTLIKTTSKDEWEESNRSTTNLQTCTGQQLRCTKLDDRQLKIYNPQGRGGRAISPMQRCKTRWRVKQKYRFLTMLCKVATNIRGRINTAAFVFKLAADND